MHDGIPGSIKVQELTVGSGVGGPWKNLDVEAKKFAEARSALSTCSGTSGVSSTDPLYSSDRCAPTRTTSGSKMHKTITTETRLTGKRRTVLILGGCICGPAAEEGVAARASGGP